MVEVLVMVILDILSSTVGKNQVGILLLIKAWAEREVVLLYHELSHSSQLLERLFRRYIVA